MASLRPGKGGGFILCFRYGGKQFNRFVGTDAREAEARRKRAEATILDLTTGRLRVPDDCPDLGTFIISDGAVTEKPQPPELLTLQAVLDRYQADLPEAAKDASTRATERVHFGHLRKLLGSSTAYPTLQTSDLQRYIRDRSKEKGKRGLVKTATIKKEIETFQVVWNSYALPHKIVKESFRVHFGKLIFPKEQSKPPFQTFDQIRRQIDRGGLSGVEQANLWDSLFLDRHQVGELLGVIQKAKAPPWLYPMALCAAHTGARLSELIRSQPDDFDLETATVHWREKKRNKERDHTYRPVRMSSQLSAVMQAWLADCRGVLTFGIRRKKTAWDWLKEVVVGSKWEHIRGWHLFRHSLASILAMEGTDQRIIDATLGHSTEEMRQRYRHLFPSQQQAALDSVFA